MSSGLVSLSEAQDRVLALAQAGPTETVPIHEASGRVCTEDIVAAWSLPQADVSIMDGFAARAADLQAGSAEAVTLRRVGESAAGHPARRGLQPGCAAQISTGAILPEGADLVVPKEDVEVQDDRITVFLQRYGSVAPGRWVRPRGSDMTAGEVVVAAGTRLGPGDMCAIAATGHTQLRAHRRPSVAIVSTGDELVAPGIEPSPGQVVSTNALLLGDLVAQSGAMAVDAGIVADDPEILRDALHSQLTHDVVITSGGASVGEHDLVAPTLVSLGCTRVLHGVALKPGKPTGVFVAPNGTLVFVLPGNPASTLVAFWLLVRPALRRMLGVRGCVLPPLVDVQLRTEARGAGGRVHYVRATLHPDGTATVLADQRSGNLRSIADFDAFVEVPAGHSDLQAGDTARAMVVDPWWYERRSSS